MPNGRAAGDGVVAVPHALLKRFQLSLGEVKFGQREKAWTVLLVFVAVGFTGYRVVVKPRTDAVRKARAAKLRVEGELTKLEATRPNVQAELDNVQAARTQVAALYHELEGLEDGLLNSQDLDLLLQRVVEERKRLKVQIIAVKPMKDESEKPKTRPPPSAGKEKDKAVETSFYKRMLVQVDAYASFDDLITYIEALDRQAPYQRVQGVKVKLEGQELMRPRVLIALQTLLSDLPEETVRQRQEIFANVKQLAAREAKDPFLAGEKPKEEELAVGLELTGIFGEGSALTALINGEPYQVGDVIQDKRIVAIRPDRVVLEHGARRFLLYVQRGVE